MAERWGIRGTDWQQIRHIPRGEQVARGWAQALPQGRRADTITLYRDTGEGWSQVATYEAHRAVPRVPEETPDG